METTEAVGCGRKDNSGCIALLAKLNDLIAARDELLAERDEILAEIHERTANDRVQEELRSDRELSSD